MILEDVTRALIHLLKARVYPKVEVMPHVDFWELAGLPAIILGLPQISEQPNEARNEPRREVDVQAGVAYVRPPVVLYDLEYSVTLASDSPITTPETVGILDLQARYLKLVGSVRVLEVGAARFPLVHEPNFAGGPAAREGPVFTVRSTLFVRDVPLASDEAQQVYIVRRRGFRYYELPR